MANMHTNNGARVLIDGSITRERFALIEIRERRGGGTLCHRHRKEDEMIYILEGEIAHEVGGELSTASAGECVFLPAGSEHGYTVTSDEARLLVLVSPAGLEGFYQHNHKPGAPSSGDIEYLASLAAHYGIEITGPAPDIDR